MGERNERSRETHIHRLKAASEEDALNKLKQFNLQGVAERIESRLLVIHGATGTSLSFAPWRRIAEEAGKHAELWLFEDGNHFCLFRHRS